MSKPYFSILTQVGENLIANALALGTTVEITHMAVGDGGGALPTPNPTQTKLKNEVRRAAVNTLFTEENNPSVIIAEQIIPEKDGGWWVREVGLYDKQGNLIAVGNCPESYKPQTEEGSGRTQVIRMAIVVKSTDCIELKIDPSVVLATREYVDKEIKSVKDSPITGYGTVGSFHDGLIHINELTSIYQTVYFDTDGKFYRWTGMLPKKVPAKSTPLSTGGIGEGKWLAVNSGDSIQELIKHENDPSAHNDIRQAIITTVNTHNNNVDAHPELHDFLAGSTARIERKIDEIHETSLATGRIYKNIADGLASTQNGEHFKVIGDGADFAVLYLNNNGEAKYINSQPSTAAIKGNNLLFDAMNEISSANEGRAFGLNLFSNSGNGKFKTTNNMGIASAVAYSENGDFISKQYPANLLPLIKGEVLYCSALAFSEADFKDFMVYFRKGISVVSTKTIRSRNSGVEVLNLAINIPSDDFDIIEFRIAGEKIGEDGLLELGGFSASYGTYSNFNSAPNVYKNPHAGNLLWDAHNEYSSLMDNQKINWFLNEIPNFVDDINLGINTIEVNDRFYKTYDVSHLQFLQDVPIYAGATVYSQEKGAVLYIQYLKGNNYITTPRQTLEAGMNQVSIKTILPAQPDTIRFLIEPVGGSKTRVNDFFVSYDNVNTKKSGSVPAKYRYLNISPTQNLLSDSFNETSAIYPTAPYDWFGKGWVKPEFRQGRYIQGDSVLFAKGEGRLAKSYDIRHLNLDPTNNLVVSCLLHVESGICKFYAQFMKNAQYLEVPQKEFKPGTHKVRFILKNKEIPTHLNFLFDLDSDAQIEVTNFTLANGLNPILMSAPLPAWYIKALSEFNDERTQYPPLRNFFVKREQLSLNAAIKKETPSGQELKGIINRILNIAFIGDSWTHEPSRYTGSLATQLANQYGDAGAGWISFSAYNRLGDTPWLGANGNIRPHLYKVTYDNNNNWTKGIYANCATPDICSAGSNVVGAKITVNGIRAIDKATLLFLPSSGVFEYRFNQDEWKSVDASGNDESIKSIILDNLPNSDKWTFELVVKSGTCLIAGLNVVQEKTGIICHKLGATGSHSRNWAEQDNHAMVESFKLLNLDTVFILLGTNDQGAKITPSLFKDNIQVIINRLRKANPAIDICLVSPSENLRGDNLYPMSDYAAQLSILARENDCGYVNLQTSFGLNPSYYAADGINPLFHSDKIHPEPTTGGKLISSAFIRVMM